MLKRTIYLTRPGYLSLKNNQLVFRQKDTEDKKIVPVEDLGFLVVENQQVVISVPLIEKLAEHNVATVFCNSKHLPQSLLLTLEGNHQQTGIQRQQIAASEPLKKNLWKQTVTAKIRNQAGALEKLGIKSSPLNRLAKEVKSGDSDNREGMAARIYWKKLLGDEFSRERYGSWPNAALNYGYMVVRAAAARALTGSGLLPAFGIFHRNRYNAFCLADDIIEPYRPFVDLTAREISIDRPDSDDLDTEIKSRILEVLSCDTGMKKNKRPLMVALTHTTASLAACYTGQRKQIDYATLL